MAFYLCRFPAEQRDKIAILIGYADIVNAVPPAHVLLCRGGGKYLAQLGRAKKFYGATGGHRTLVVAAACKREGGIR